MEPEREAGTEPRRGLAEGYIEAITTDYAVLWMNEEGKLKGLPLNRMATYLWWRMDPEAEGRDQFCGTIFVTGHADEHGDMTPVSEDVIRLFGQMDEIRRREEAEGPSGDPAPSGEPAP